MGKKIVISESQYKRVFLNEQYDRPKGWAKWNPHIRMWTHPAYTDYPDVPKENIYIKNSDGTFSLKYPEFKNLGSGDSGYVSIDDPDIRQQTMDLENKKFIEKTFNKNIKDRESGNKFREWVRDDIERLKYVEKGLKKNNLSGTLDAKGDHTNEYMKIAWGLVGRRYLIDSRTKKDIESEFGDWKNENPTYGDYYQIKDISYANNIKNQVRNSNEYKNYVSALNNRKKVKSSFGWTDKESINSSDNLVKILSGEVPASTCINPESLILDLTFAKNSINQFDKNSDPNNWFQNDRVLTLTSGGWNKGATSEYFTSWEKDSELENRYKEYRNKEKELRIECPIPQRIIKDIPVKVDNTYHTANEKNKGITNFKKYSNKEDNQINSYDDYFNYSSQEQFDACQRKVNTLVSEYSGIEEEYRKYLSLKKQQNSTIKELESMGFEVNETSLMDVRQINQLLYVLEQVNIHNLIISGQSSKKEEQLCDNIVYGEGVRYENRRQSDGLGSITMKVPVKYNKTFSWVDVCKNRGGVFTYPLERKTIKGSAKSIGWVSNQGYCMCVRNNQEEIYGKKIHEWAESNDTRNWYDPDRIADAVKDCTTDWHCVLDIVSIAAYAFGPVGAIVSGIVDAISAIGYVVEGDEGWKMNAGLTALGMFGIGEGISLAKKGVKFSNKLNDLGTIISKNVDNAGKIKNAFKLEREIAEWTKGLSDVEKKLYKDFRKLNSKIGDEGGRKFLDDITKKMKDLPNANKGTLKKMFDDLEPDDMKKLFDESGGDLLKMTNKYSKGIRGAVIQGTIFLGMYVYSDKLGEGLHYLYEKYGLDPLGVFGEKGSTNNFDEDSFLNFDDIISNKEQVDSYIDSLGVNGSDYEEENKLFLSVLEPLMKLRKETDNEVKDKLDELYQKFLNIINGKRYKKVDIEPIVNIMTPALDEISSIVNTSKTEEVVKLIDETIKKLDSKDKPKISKKEKTAVIVTGDINLTEEDIEEVNFFINELKQNPNDIKEEKKYKNMELNEEIKRMKSLFSNDRLYGNLIDEACSSESEAKEYLQDKGYIVKDPSTGDLCLGPSTNLGKIYKKYQPNNMLKFQSPNTKSGDCVLGLYAKDKGSWDNNFFLINLFDGVDGKVFNMYFKVTDTIACTKRIAVLDSPIDVVVTKSGVDTTTTPPTIGVGLSYVKLEGDWSIDGTGNVNLKNIFVVRLMNDNKKGIQTFVDVPGLGEADLSSTTGLSSEGVNSGNGTVLRNSSGSCDKIKKVLEEKLGATFTTGISLDGLISKMTV